MKVAICISGQPRTWKKAYGSWNNLFNLEYLIKSKYEYSKGIVYHKTIEEDDKGASSDWVLPANANQDLPSLDNLLDTLEYLKGEEKIEIDYFCHLWDFDSSSWGTWTKEQWDAGLYDSGLTDPPSISADVSEFIQQLEPVKCIVEDEMKSKTRKVFMDDVIVRRVRNVEKWSPLSWAGSQLYGIMMAGQLKKQHELEQGFQYDVCVRMRPDLLFDSASTHVFHCAFVKPENHWMYSCHNFTSDRYPHHGVGDVFFYADSETYDLISNFYSWCPEMDPDIFPDDIRIEEVFSYFVRMFKIKNFIMPLDPKPTGSKVYTDKKKGDKNE